MTGFPLRPVRVCSQIIDALSLSLKKKRVLGTLCIILSKLANSHNSHHGANVDLLMLLRRALWPPVVSLESNFTRAPKPNRVCS